MRIRVILVAMLFVLLALPMAVQAQEPEPEVVVSDQVAAVNEGDATSAQVTMAEDATVTVPAATVTDTAAPAPTEGEGEGEGKGEDEDPAAAAAADPAAEQQYTGTAETQAYLEGQTAANANTTLGECSVAGETVTCAASYTSAALQGRGIDFLEGTLVVTVVEGKIQTFDFTPSAASIAKIQAAFAAPSTLPVSGGTTPAPTYATTFMVLAVLGLVLVLAGAVTYAYQRHGV